MAEKKKKKNEEPRAPWRVRALREARYWVVSLAVAAAVILPLRAAVADWYDVPTGSMRPTILEGDRIFVQNIAFGLRIPMTRSWITRWGQPERGDIVTLASPQTGERLVKRVIGVPGDRIAMVEGRIRINGKIVDYEMIERDILEPLSNGRRLPAMRMTEFLPGKPHVVTLIPQIRSIRSFEEIEIPQGQYFVMGDNRDQSADSRIFGFVPEDWIYGRGTHIALSFDGGNPFKPRFGRWLDPLR